MQDELKLAGVFGDHAVLQQGAALPVWGWAAPGAGVEVAFAGQRASARADADGAWRVRLTPLAAGGPHTLTVRSGGAELVLRDIMVGEVWVCSGQSNMEWPVSASASAAEETADADRWPLLRLLTVPKLSVDTPADTLAGVAWEPCSRHAIPNFSAVAYSFGRCLQRETGVAIGLINASWGGTNAETWASRESLLAEPELRPLVEQIELDPETKAELHRRWRRDMDACEALTLCSPNRGWPQGWAAPGPLDGEWKPFPVPQYWQAAGYAFSGVLWFRREVDIPPAWAGRPLALAIGACDKSDITYFNNVEVGSLNIKDAPDAWCRLRTYTVPGGLVRAGRNTIAVRVMSHVYGGGMTGPADAMSLGPLDGARDEAIPLAGEWRCRVEQNFGTIAMPPAPPLRTGECNTPYALFCGMIAPLVPYGIRGAIWYQGESNIGRARQYRTLFPAMIRGWRQAWGQGDFPFYFVQLASFQPPRDTPADSDWAELREAQAAALCLPDTGMAVAIDIGDVKDIHPKNKQEVGRRLALHALAQVHGRRNLPAAGPTRRAMTVEGGVVRLRFDGAEGGLVCRGPELAGFAVAGADRRFAWAEARIEGSDTVVLTCAAVPAPVAVRYAWADTPPVTLYNGAGLPAAPFRTDDWPAPKPA